MIQAPLNIKGKKIKTGESVFRSGYEEIPELVNKLRWFLFHESSCDSPEGVAHNFFLDEAGVEEELMKSFGWLDFLVSVEDGKLIDH